MGFVKVGAAYNKAEGPKSVLKSGGKRRDCDCKDKVAEELGALEAGVVSVSLSVMRMSSFPACARVAAVFVRLVNSAEGLVSGFFTGALEEAWFTC